MTVPMNPKPEAKNRKTAATPQPNGARSKATSSRRAMAPIVVTELRLGRTWTGGAILAGTAVALTRTASERTCRTALCLRALVRARRREDLLTLTHTQGQNV